MLLLVNYYYLLECIISMECGSWWLKLLWYLPHLPKKKIKMFVKLGDNYRKIGKEARARYCYQQALTLAGSLSAVYYIKKIEARFKKQPA